MNRYLIKQAVREIRRVGLAVGNAAAKLHRNGDGDPPEDRAIQVMVKAESDLRGIADVIEDELGE